MFKQLGLGLSRLKPQAFERLLQKYPDQDLVRFLVRMTGEGVSLGIKAPPGVRIATSCRPKPGDAKELQR